jgi:hypothetical protein
MTGTLIKAMLIAAAVSAIAAVSQASANAIAIGELTCSIKGGASRKRGAEFESIFVGRARTYRAHLRCAPALPEFRTGGSGV